MGVVQAIIRCCDCMTAWFEHGVWSATLRWSCLELRSCSLLPCERYRVIHSPPRLACCSKLKCQTACLPYSRNPHSTECILVTPLAPQKRQETSWDTQISCSQSQLSTPWSGADRSVLATNMSLQRPTLTKSTLDAATPCGLRRDVSHAPGQGRSGPSHIGTAPVRASPQHISLAPTTLIFLTVLYRQQQT